MLQRNVLTGNVAPPCAATRAQFLDVLIVIGVELQQGPVDRLPLALIQFCPLGVSPDTADNLAEEAIGVDLTILVALDVQLVVVLRKVPFLEAALVDSECRPDRFGRPSLLLA